MSKKITFEDIQRELAEWKHDLDANEVRLDNIQDTPFVAYSGLANIPFGVSIEGFEGVTAKRVPGSKLRIWNDWIPGTYITPFYHDCHKRGQVIWGSLKINDVVYRMGDSFFVPRWRSHEMTAHKKHGCGFILTFDMEDPDDEIL